MVEPMSLYRRAPDIWRPFDPEVLDTLLADFEATAAARDEAGGTAKRERDLIRESGLLGLSIPRDLGGLGGSIGDVLTVTRAIAAVDSALAHLFAFHHFQLATLQFYGPRQQWAPLLEETARHNWFWGNALNPLDKSTRITCGPDLGEHRINGTKTFCSGATDSDMLVVSAIRADKPGLTVAAIPTSRDGVVVHDDWDNMGQRQTDSGRVSFKDVAVLDEEILREPGPLGSPFASLRSSLGQLILTEIYLGLAEGALAHAVAHVDANGPAWIAAKVATAGEDPLILRNFGDYWVQTAGAAALTERAQTQFQAAFDLGPALEADERAEVAVSIATAKVAAARAALDVSSRMFEVLGARSTAAKLRFDRFWRNARTHTLHDPVDHKLQELGDWRLNGRLPTPSFYS
ncbi:MAG: monooxygenase [Caulobacteraceae bacterium]|nr:monooxygenase [Caulobacteraceae bacterium]